MALDRAGYPTSMGFRNIAFLIVPLVVKWLFFISLLTSRIWLESPVIWHFSYVGWGHFPCEASSKSTDSSFRTLSWHPELKSGHLSWKEPWRPKHNRPQTELNIYPYASHMPKSESLHVMLMWPVCGCPFEEQGLRSKAPFHNPNNWMVKICGFYLVCILSLISIPISTAFIQHFMTPPSIASLLTLFISQTPCWTMPFFPTYFSHNDKSETFKWFSMALKLKFLCLVCRALHPISRPSSSITFPHSLHLNELLLLPQTHCAVPRTLAFLLSLAPIGMPLQTPKLILRSSSQDQFICRLHTKSSLIPSVRVCINGHNFLSFSAFTFLPWPHPEQSIRPHTATLRLALCLALANITEAERIVPVPRPFYTNLWHRYEKIMSELIPVEAWETQGAETLQELISPSPTLISWPSEDPQTWR